MGNSYSTDTCSEIIEILDHIPRVLYDKLPSSIINYFYQNADVRNKQFEYNVAFTPNLLKSKVFTPSGSGVPYKSSLNISRGKWADKSDCKPMSNVK